MFGRKVGTAFAIGPCMPIILLCSACLWRSRRAKVADAAGAKEQPSDKPSEVAPARFKSDVRKCFGFHVSKHVSGEKPAERQKTTHRQWQCCTAIRTPEVKKQALVAGRHLWRRWNLRDLWAEDKDRMSDGAEGLGRSNYNGKTSFRYQSGFQELMNYYCCWWLFFPTHDWNNCLSHRLCWYGLLLYTGLCQMFFWNLVHHWAALYNICNYYITLVISYITSKKKSRNCSLQRK